MHREAFDGFSIEVPAGWTVTTYADDAQHLPPVSFQGKGVLLYGPDGLFLDVSVDLAVDLLGGDAWWKLAPAPGGGITVDEPALCKKEPGEAEEPFGMAVPGCWSGDGHLDVVGAAEVGGHTFVFWGGHRTREMVGDVRAVSAVLRTFRAQPRARRMTPDEVIAGAPPELHTLALRDASSLPGVIEEVTKTGPNDWYQESDASLHTVMLPGLELAFAVSGARPEGRGSLFVSATYKSSYWKLPGGLVVGCPVEAVLELLGPADASSDAAHGVLRYETTNEGATNLLEIRTADGRVTEIRIIPYSG